MINMGGYNHLVEILVDKRLSIIPLLYNLNNQGVLFIAHMNVDDALTSQNRVKRHHFL